MNKWRESAPQLEASCLFLSTSSINLKSYIRPSFSLPQCWSLLGPWWQLLLNARMHQCPLCDKIPCSRCLFSGNMYITLSWLLISLICLLFSFVELVFIRKKSQNNKRNKTLFAAVNFSDFCACVLGCWAKKIGKVVSSFGIVENPKLVSCVRGPIGDFLLFCLELWVGFFSRFFLYIYCLASTWNVVVKAQLSLNRST